MKIKIRYDIYMKLKSYFEKHVLFMRRYSYIKFVSILLGLVSPLLYRYFINEVISKNRNDKLVYVVGGYILLFFVLSVLMVLERIYENKYKNLLQINMKKKMWSIYSNISLDLYDTYIVADLRRRIEMDLNKIISFLIDHIINFSFMIINIIGVAIIMFIVNWRLALYGILVASVSLLITKVLGTKINQISGKSREILGQFENSVFYSLLSWKEIKVHALEEQQMNLLDEEWKKISFLEKKQTMYKNIVTSLVVTNMFVLTRLGMYLYGGILVFQGNMDVASLLVFITYYEKIQQQLNLLVQEIVDLEEVQPVIYKVLEILGMPNKNRVRLKMTGLLKFENVTFGYDQKISIFENMNLRIPLQKHIAIVGKSGCGKSTLTDLALGLVKVNSGKVCIDSFDVQSVTDKTRSKVISAVLQEPKFFNLSIRENLEIVKPRATIEELEAVCNKVNLLEEIRKLPYKWDTIIGEGGIQMSGGQLQRLAIARVLLINPDIIIFDEATSSLDKQNENIICTNILRPLGGKTYISITHRNSIILESDIIYEINDRRCIKRQKNSRNTSYE